MYSHVRTFLVYYIIFEFLYLSGLSCEFHSIEIWQIKSLRTFTASVHYTVTECFGPSFCFENDTNLPSPYMFQIIFEGSHAKMYVLSMPDMYLFSAEAKCLKNETVLCVVNSNKVQTITE